MTEGDVFAAPSEDIICRLRGGTTEERCNSGPKAQVRFCGCGDIRESQADESVIVPVSQRIGTGSVKCLGIVDIVMF